MPQEDASRKGEGQRVTLVLINDERKGEPQAAFPVSHGDKCGRADTAGEVPCGQADAAGELLCGRADTPWEALARVETPYVGFIRQGESWKQEDLEKMCRCLDAAGGRADAAIPDHPGKKNAGRRKKPKNRLLSLLDGRELMQVPGCLDGMLFRTEAAKSAAGRIGPGLHVQEAGEPGEDPLWYQKLACEALLRRPVVVYVEEVRFRSLSPFADGGGYRKEWTQAKWYLDVAEQLCGWASGRYGGSAEDVPPLVQAQILYLLKILFQENLNNLDKGALRGEVFERFYRGCLESLKYVDGRLISGCGGNTRGSRQVCKGGKNVWQGYPTDSEMHQERLLTPELGTVFAQMKYEAMGCRLGPDWEPMLPVTMQLMEFVREDGDRQKEPGSEGYLHMDFEIGSYLLEEGRSLTVTYDGVTVPYTLSPRYCAARIFGRRFGRTAFCVDIPYGNLGRGGRLAFFLASDGEERRLGIVSTMYQSRISSFVDYSYWCFGKYMASFLGKGTEREGIQIRRACRAARMLQELKTLAFMPFGKNRSRRMFAQRVGYWLAWPVYRKKNIWLTFDKLYKGGDCGEYFYKYMVGRKDADVVPAYVIREGAADRKRLEQEGYEPLIYGTQKHRLFYLYARMVFATHSSVHAFNAFNAWEVQFIQDRLRAVNTCIQHGLSVQDLTADSNRVVNNNKRYYCASRYEVENLSGTAYDYRKDVLCLTGIPRFDGLENRDRRQILVTPTWRSYLAMPAVVGSARPYNPEFKKTEYFRIYENLLADEKLIRTAARTGYRIVYLLHPVLGAQKEDFTVGEGVCLLSAAEAGYETALMESSLMVTDYSGVQFDFAYMRKPVVYYHPPALWPHYGEGGFDYERQGFGEICADQESLVELLCSYMEQGCAVKPFYRKRQDDFFAFDDRGSCARIYEDAKKWQQTHMDVM